MAGPFDLWQREQWHGDGLIARSIRFALNAPRPSRDEYWEFHRDASFGGCHFCAAASSAPVAGRQKRRYN